MRRIRKVRIISDAIDREETKLCEFLIKSLLSHYLPSLRHTNPALRFIQETVNQFSRSEESFSALSSVTLYDTEFIGTLLTDVQIRVVGNKTASAIRRALKKKDRTWRMQVSLLIKRARDHLLKRICIAVSTLSKTAPVG